MRRPHRAVHHAVWCVLLVALPLMLVAAMVLRQNGPHQRAPERLSPPSAAAASGAASATAEMPAASGTAAKGAHAESRTSAAPPRDGTVGEGGS